MREVQASEAKAHLASLLDDVERGETLIITRHGKRVARIVPEGDRKIADGETAIAEIKIFRATMPRVNSR